MRVPPWEMGIIRRSFNRSDLSSRLNFIITTFSQTEGNQGCHKQRTQNRRLGYHQQRYRQRQRSNAHLLGKGCCRERISPFEEKPWPGQAASTQPVNYAKQDVHRFRSANSAIGDPQGHVRSEHVQKSWHWNSCYIRFPDIAYRRYAEHALSILQRKNNATFFKAFKVSENSAGILGSEYPPHLSPRTTKVAGL